jgi:hypothetical protein
MEEGMKTLFKSYRISKYHKLINGVIFAFLAMPFFIWGLFIILQADHACFELIYPLVGMLICLIAGLRSMLTSSQKITAL